MDFSWPTAQQELFEQTREFARSLAQDVRDRDSTHQFCRQSWNACGDFGVLGLSLPTTYGGMGLDALHTTHIVEALGEGCGDQGLVFSAMAHLFACAMPIYEHGDPELRSQHLPALASGRAIGANAITEEQAGSDVFALKTTAERRGDVYRLNGVKNYVTNGPIADTFLVYATTNPGFGYMGITAFVVPRDTAGLVVGQPIQKVGLTTSPMASLYLEDCDVPVGARLGNEGSGAAIFRASMHWERACLFGAYVGSMARQLDQAVAYAQSRQQFRKPIGKNQAVAHRIADMKLRLESARLLLYRACWAKTHGDEATLEISLAKLAVSEAAIQSGLDLIRIHGGQGVTSENGLDRPLRDALPSVIFSGTSDIQRELIANQLGL